MILATIFVAVAFHSESLLWAAQQDLTKADWSATSAHNLATNPPSDKAVLDFIKKLHNVSDDTSASLCSFEFSDLRNRSNLSLVASWASGRVCSVEIIDKTASGFEVYDTDISSFEVRDLDGNGTLGLIGRVDLTYYHGAPHCQATWPVIYAWTGSGYDDVSSKNRSFYQKRLDSLNKEIASLSSSSEQMQALETNQESAPESTTNRHIKLVPLRTDADLPPSEAPSPAATPAPRLNLGNANCVKAEAAKIERFLGSPDAGMTDAIQWANSDDPRTREFASDVLSDIGTPDAIRYLETLSKDTDPVVAGHAKSDLRVLAKGGRQYKIERREDLPR